MTIQERPLEIAQPALAFPRGFRWGGATAAYQIEGAVSEDGRGPSVWDTFSRTAGKVLGGDTGDVACDHYHRFREDVKLMADLGFTAYRFSIGWPRVQPGGTGPGNPAGFDFYQRLVDELLNHGIEPWVTLYHWDLPQPLEDAGGWPERDTAYRFADYVTLVHSRLGDRVRRWITINEPWCVSFLGYGSGVHAPGRRESAAAVRAAHHVLLAHGLGVRALREADSQAEVGPALNLYAVSAAGDSAEDADAARRIDGLANRMWLDAVLLGTYPQDVVSDLAPISDFGHVRDGDMEIISSPSTFLAINYYSRYVVAAPVAVSPCDPAVASPWPGSENVRFVSREGVPVTAMGWEIDAPGLTETLLRVSREYPSIPLFITENGAAFDDVVDHNGEVHDPERVAYLDAHLRACHEAISEGVPLGGYFAWSLLDNFEWALGYSKRFGLVHVDYTTQQRTPKSSARWFSQVARRNGLDATGT